MVKKVRMREGLWYSKKGMAPERLRSNTKMRMQERFSYSKNCADTGGVTVW